MTHSRRRVMRLAGLLALPATAALVLAGCSGSGSGDAGSGDGKSFTFTFATSNNLESPYESLAKEYMEQHEGVTITTNPTPNDKYGETIRTQLQAGNASDVIQTTPGSGDARSILPLAEAGFLEPLGDSAKSLIIPGSESVYTIDDQVYGQPLDFTIGAIVASLGTAKMKGLDDFPTTMSEFTAACSSLQSQGASLLALAGAAGPNVGLTIQGISATRVYADTPDWNQQRTDGEVTFADSQGWKDTLQTFVDLKDAGCFQPGAEGGGFDAITNGLAQGTSVGSFIPSGAAIEISKAAPAEAEFAVEPFPAESGEPMVLGSSNYTLSINAKAQNKEAAADFLTWMAEPAQQQRYYELSGELPVSAFDTLDLTGTIYEPVADLLKNKQYTPLPNNIWPNPSVYEALQVGGQGLLTGQSTIDQVLQSMDAAWGN
ncbi:extracellular solute-binding protein [Microbacterium enclense]|uniref:Extracellular solute-binding protein n=1 Tax=Microbacterium enclense TaxID=993073 RepID=A0A443JFS5_9MICO|nr:extracellular solute-binding protein [Microbacterium enclense]RWR19341.1 extracellular solute-binding protein [Microbacterium enclense]